MTDHTAAPPNSSPPDDVGLDPRKATILRAVVAEYIETAQPVGSGHVAKAPGVNVSSATTARRMVAFRGSRPTSSGGEELGGAAVWSVMAGTR